MNKIIINSFIGIVLLITLSGCSAKGPQFQSIEQPIEGESNIYIFRTGILGQAVQPDIHHLDKQTNIDSVIGSVKPDGYILSKVKPGKHLYWAKTEARNEVEIVTKKNEIYCIEHYIGMGFFVGHPQFEIVDMEKCKKELKKTRLSLPEK
jgi:hypothetical protein